MLEELLPVFTLTGWKRVVAAWRRPSLVGGCQWRGHGNLQRASANTPTRAAADQPASRATDGPHLLYLHLCCGFLQRCFQVAAIYFPVRRWRGLCCSVPTFLSFAVFLCYLQVPSAVGLGVAFMWTQPFFLFFLEMPPLCREGREGGRHRHCL